MSKKIRAIEQHPISRLFPAMTLEEYQFAKDDIRRQGQKEPILLYEGKVLDGWHRYRICVELGIEPLCKALSKKTQPLSEIISRNLARRQLSPAQRYGILLRIAEEYPEVQAGIDA